MTRIWTCFVPDDITPDVRSSEPTGSEWKTRQIRLYTDKPWENRSRFSSAWDLVLKKKTNKQTNTRTENFFPSFSRRQYENNSEKKKKNETFPRTRVFITDKSRSVLKSRLKRVPVRRAAFRIRPKEITQCGRPIVRPRIILHRIRVIIKTYYNSGYSPLCACKKKFFRPPSNSGFYPSHPFMFSQRFRPFAFLRTRNDPALDAVHSHREILCKYSVGIFLKV